MFVIVTVLMYNFELRMSALIREDEIKGPGSVYENESGLGIGSAPDYPVTHASGLFMVVSQSHKMAAV